MFDFPSKDFYFTTLLAKNSKSNLRHFKQGFIWRLNFKNQIRSFVGQTSKIFYKPTFGLSGNNWRQVDDTGVGRTHGSAEPPNIPCTTSSIISHFVSLLDLIFKSWDVLEHRGGGFDRTLGSVEPRSSPHHKS